MDMSSWIIAEFPSYVWEITLHRLANDNTATTAWSGIILHEMGIWFWRIQCGFNAENERFPTSNKSYFMPTRAYVTRTRLCWAARARWNSINERQVKRRCWGRDRSTTTATDTAVNCSVSANCWMKSKLPTLISHTLHTSFTYHRSENIMYALPQVNSKEKA